eukprot:1149816-Pelagomonas_calceolata.AAC.2
MLVLPANPAALGCVPSNGKLIIMCQQQQFHAAFWPELAQVTSALTMAEASPPALLQTSRGQLFGAKLKSGRGSQADNGSDWA